MATNVLDQKCDSETRQQMPGVKFAWGRWGPRSDKTWVVFDSKNVRLSKGGSLRTRQEGATEKTGKEGL